MQLGKPWTLTPLLAVDALNCVWSVRSKRIELSILPTLYIGTPAAGRPAVVVSHGAYERSASSFRRSWPWCGQRESVGYRENQTLERPFWRRPLQAGTPEALGFPLLERALMDIREQRGRGVLSLYSSMHGFERLAPRGIWH